MSEANSILMQLFSRHGVECAIRGNSIEFPLRNMKAEANFFKETPREQAMSLQLDVRFEYRMGRVIVESFSGIGKTREEAIANAFQNFAANTFHVLLGAFFNPDDDQINREDWEVRSGRRNVVIGNYGIRGNFPSGGSQLEDLLNRLKRKVERAELSAETHWIRLFYAQIEKRPLAHEALLDNDVWDGMQAEVAAVDWQASADFYSVRLFVIIRDNRPDDLDRKSEDYLVNGSPTPEEAVAKLSALLQERTELIESDIYNAMSDAGLPQPVADRAYKFTMIAWGRVLLDGMGIGFSSDYLCFDANGKIIETGLLNDQPYYRAAMSLARQNPTESLPKFALMSSEVAAVNGSLNGGSKAENIVLAPVALFMEAPSEVGFQAARQLLEDRLRPNKSVQKPWWRFW